MLRFPRREKKYNNKNNRRSIFLVIKRVCLTVQNPVVTNMRKISLTIVHFTCFIRNKLTQAIAATSNPLYARFCFEQLNLANKTCVKTCDHFPEIVNLERKTKCLSPYQRYCKNNRKLLLFYNVANFIRILTAFKLPSEETLTDLTDKESKSTITVYSLICWTGTVREAGSKPLSAVQL